MIYSVLSELTTVEILEDMKRGSFVFMSNNAYSMYSFQCNIVLCVGIVEAKWWNGMCISEAYSK
jgi:hypothetical protein